LNGHRRVAAAVALLVVGMGATGCGGGAGGPSGDIKRTDINPMPRDRIRDGGTLRVPIEQFSTQWNYNHLNGPESSTSAVTGPLLPGPIISDERANITPDTDYVLSWSVRTKPRQVVTYRLNPKARWSNGQPITWRDYEAQWKALRGTDKRYEIASSTGYERVASVRRGRNQYEVVVTFARPYSEWQGMFGPLYPAATNSSPRTFNTGWLNKIPVSAGPFRLQKIDQTAKTITVVRDPKWWGRPAKLDAIVFRALPIEAQINAFVNGEVDLVDVGPDASHYRRVRGVPGASIRKAAGPDFRHLTFQGTAPILKDVRVRRAIAMAINRDAIAKADLTGLDWPVRTMNNHYFVNTQEGYQDNAGEVGRFDPAKARRLLDQAGWRLSGPVRAKAGKPLELRFIIPTGVPVSKQESELIGAMLRDVGIKIDVRAVPSDDFFDRYVSTGNFDLVPFSWLGGVFPISSAKSIYAAPTKNARGELQIQQNFARVGSPAIDRLQDRAQEELDINRARGLLNQADKLIWSEVHSIVLYQRPQIVAIKSNIANDGASGFKTTPIQDVGFVK
jgi:peptide/nickel transport system substrate-binding protein